MADSVFLHLHSTVLETTLSPTFLHTTHLTFQQQQCLKAGFESIKSWFDVFLTLSPATYIGFPFSILSQLFRCVCYLTRLYQLTALGDLSWDEDCVRKTADTPLILDRVIVNLEQVAGLAGLVNSNNSERDAFSRTAQMFRSLRPGWEAKVGPDNPSITSIPHHINETLTFLENTNETFPSNALAAEFSDSDWLADLFLTPIC